MNLSPDEATRRLEELAERLQSLDYGPAADLAVRAVQGNIDRADELYAPRVSPYDDGHPLLYETGAMRENVRSDVQASGTGFEITITDDMDYGDYINEGTSRMVARPFMDVPDEAVQQMEDMIADQLRDI